MKIPHNQQLGHTWLIIIPYVHHDNWSVLGKQYLSIPGLECSGRTKKIMWWCVLIMASRVGHKSHILRVPDDENLAMSPAHRIELLLNCTQLITNYTRSTLSSVSTIDHIYTSMPELKVCSGVIPCSWSDHDIIYTVFKHPNKSKTQPRVISILNFKIFDIMEYNKDLTCLMDLFKIVYINLHCSLIAWYERVTIGRTPNIANHVFRHLKNIYQLKLFFFTSIQLTNMSGDLQV